MCQITSIGTLGRSAFALSLPEHGWCNHSNTGKLNQGIQMKPPSQARLLLFLSLTFSRRRLGNETEQLGFPIC